MANKLKASMLLVIGLFTLFFVSIPKEKIDSNYNRDALVRSLLQDCDTIVLGDIKWYKDREIIIGCKNGHKEFMIINKE